MVSAAEVQEALTSVEELAINFLIVIIQYSKRTAKAVNLLFSAISKNFISIAITLLAVILAFGLDVLKRLVFFSVFYDLFRYNGFSDLAPLQFKKATMKLSFMPTM